MKVWVVMSGEYSDTTFQAVFSTKELADEFIERMNNANGGYSQYWLWDDDGHDLDEHLPQMRDGFRFYQVSMKKDGSSTVKDKGEGLTDTETWSRFDSCVSPKLIVTCRAKDKEHAAKIANEKRVQLIAANEWPAKRK
jgi:hypothetical protein